MARGGFGAVIIFCSVVETPPPPSRGGNPVVGEQTSFPVMSRWVRSVRFLTDLGISFIALWRNSSSVKFVQKLMGSGHTRNSLLLIITEFKKGNDTISSGRDWNEFSTSSSLVSFVSTLSDGGKSRSRFVFILMYERLRSD